ncbi:hypothetical protein MY4038_007379 [Beauveria bassiana]
MKRKVPHRDELLDYNYAVAGHAGTLCDANGELFIKPCTQAEIDFYNSVVRGSDFAGIIPTFIGGLEHSDPSDLNINDPVETLKDQIKATIAEHVSHASAEMTATAAPNDDTPWVPTNGKKIETNLAVALDNAASGFKKPNILDVKLGMRLWADNAPAAKKTRFDKIASETTHLTHGFRIAGMRVYRGSDDPARLDDEGYLVYDKDYGRVTMNKDNIIDGFRRFVFNPAAGIDEALGRVVCKMFKDKIAHVHKVIDKLETRMYSSSLLFVFEGDGEALRAAIEQQDESKTALETKLANRTTTRTDSGIAMGGDSERAEMANGDEDDDANCTTTRTDSGIAVGDDSERAEMANGDEDDDANCTTTRTDSGIAVGDDSERAETADGDEDDDDGVGLDHDDGVRLNDNDVVGLNKGPQVLSLKLIDFAHAEWTPGRGKDHNLLFGVGELEKIFEQLSK